MFSELEINFLKAQRLARIATVAADGQPDVAPVAFEFDGEYFYIGGRELTGTLKYQNVLRGNFKVALAFDDLESISPWKPRGIKLHGHAEIVRRHGRFGEKNYLKIAPEVYWSWGISTETYAVKKHTLHKK